LASKWIFCISHCPDATSLFSIKPCSNPVCVNLCFCVCVVSVYTQISTCSALARDAILWIRPEQIWLWADQLHLVFFLRLLVRHLLPVRSHKTSHARVGSWRPGASACACAGRGSCVCVPEQHVPVLVHVRVPCTSARADVCECHKLVHQ
jgi:hypothetical protein